MLIHTLRKVGENIYDSEYQSQGHLSFSIDLLMQLDATTVELLI
jgi:hypothetical protein